MPEIAGKSDARDLIVIRLNFRQYEQTRRE